MFRLPLICAVLFVCFTSNGQCVKGNCVNGVGTLILKDGSKYLGRFQSKKPHGLGTLVYKRGGIYEGTWVNGRKQGKGKQLFANGDSYQGEFWKNKMKGYGKMMYSDGSEYKGEWQNSLRHGKGKMTYINGDAYEGGFINGKRGGNGVMRYDNGDIYVGDWSQDKRAGEGRLEYKSGKSDYGIWEQDKLIRAIHLHEPKEELLVENTLPIESNQPIEPREKETTNKLEATQKPKPTTPVVTMPTVKVRALVVGVANYQHMPSLRFTDDDAYQFYAFLKSPEGGALPDDQVTVLIDESATRARILSEMKKLFSQASKEDVVLLYFSGHGLQGAFVPSDYDGRDNVLEHHEVMSVLESSPAKHKVCIADACHSGSLMASKGSEAYAEYYGRFDKLRGGTALLLSSKSEEKSLEHSGFRQGIFSHFLIAGLKGAANENDDRIVTITELYNYVSREVTQYTADGQNPMLSGDFDPRMPVGLIRF